MDPSEKFLRFAAECEFMAKFTRSPENRTVWTRMAERWLRCARLYDRDSAMAHPNRSARRHRAPSHSSAH
jgi:ferric-dicitrate binding protein FerR (iron transport regulator)